MKPYSALVAVGRRRLSRLVVAQDEEQAGQRALAICAHLDPHGVEVSEAPKLELWEAWSALSWRSGCEGAEASMWEVWTKGAGGSAWRAHTCYEEDGRGYYVHPLARYGEIAQLMAHSSARSLGVHPQPRNAVVVYEGCFVAFYPAIKATDLCLCGHPDGQHKDVNYTRACFFSHCRCMAFELDQGHDDPPQGIQGEIPDQDLYRSMNERRDA